MLDSAYFSRAVSDVGISRSRFQNTHRNLTTMNSGFLYPIASFDVLPGSTWDIDISSFVRQSTPIHPVMDDAFLDVYAFFVPMRQTWDKTKEFFGEPGADPYSYSNDLLEPGFVAPDSESGVQPVIGARSLHAYYGVPIGSAPAFINAKYVRGYGLIWNRWYRAQQLQNAIDVPVDSINRIYASVRPDFLVDSIPDVQSNPDYYINCAKLGDVVAPVCKFHDYFTSALLQPQLGDPASIPLNGFAPVYGVSGINNIFDEDRTIIPGRGDVQEIGYVYGDLSYHYPLYSGDGLHIDRDGSTAADPTQAYFTNLVADLGLHVETSNAAAVAYSTITDLRYAFATQKYLEINNRFGTRYKEYLKGHFGVDANNIELQDPELLGGKRIHIGMQQVVQNSSTDEVSPQGNVAAYSLTSDRDFLFRKSFTEHGVIHILACIRTNHSYQQGLEKKFSKRSKFDYYHPEFANISEQPIALSEIYIQGSQAPGTAPFGFQEAWAEYRYFPNKIGGYFASQIPGSLDIWHYGDYYESRPYLSAAWIAETYKNVDRTLAVTSQLHDQFLCDFAFNITHVEPMPVYSIPGLDPHF